ncbi:MAG: site-specific integrase [Motiliproteus sp.]
MALTDAWLKANKGKARDKVLEKADREGMGARVSAKGKITFQLRYRYAGKPARLDLGSYPLISLKEARDEAERLRAEFEQGHDPRVVRLIEKKAVIEADTLSDLFYRWYNSYCIDNKKGHFDIKRSFELHVLPKLGSLQADKISIDAWMLVLDELAKKRSGIASRVLTNSKQMLSWGARRKIVPFNVLSDINARADLGIKKKKGDRVLSDREVAYVWEALENSRMSRKNQIFVKLCLVFGCRNGELRSAYKTHFNMEKGIWTVPAELHKTGGESGKPIIRPIIDEIKPLIDEAFGLSAGKYAFTNSGSSEPMGTGAPLALPYNVMQWLKRNHEYHMEHWSIHDLRRTARTNFSKLTQPHVAEIMLGHTLPGEWQTYDHHDYIEEQAEAYKAWWARLEDIIGEYRSPSDCP